MNLACTTSSRRATDPWRWSRGLLAALFLLVLAPAMAAPTATDAGMPAFPALTGPVVDEAHLLPADTFAALSRKLADYARATSTQVVVVTLPTLKGYPIDEYGYQLGRHWGIGQKGKNNGVLLIVDAGERQVRIEVGYGLEGTLTDAQSFGIIHNIIVPQFAKGAYAAGIVAGADEIISVLGTQHQADQHAQVQQRNGTGFLLLLVFLFVLLPLFGALLGRGGRGGPGSGGRGGGLGWLGWLALGMLSGGGGGFGGGGFGGGGFGGFSGGGGSFGGGGASGGW